MPRHGKRNRQRVSSRIVLELTWAWNGRDELRCRMTGRGVVESVVLNARRVDAVGRESAAAWLREHFMPRAAHDACYRLLWGR